MAVDLFKFFRQGRRRGVPHRDSIPFPNLFQQSGLQSGKKLAYKPTPRNLRWFGYNPYARRAINAIKNPISMLDWEISPVDGVDMNSELEKQIETATYCFEHPNNDDSARTLIEVLVEDILHGAGAVEMQLSGDEARPLWMWPVDGLTIQLYPLWNEADPHSVRYVQIIGYGNFIGNALGQEISLRNDELMYIRPNPSSATPFGHGALEVAFNTISRSIGTGEFAGNVAVNARPSVGLDLGAVTPEKLNQFRQYWRNEVEGGNVGVPITGLTTPDPGGTGKMNGLTVYRLYPEGDKALYLEYQEFLKREIAVSFDLSPGTLGVERDVNRNTAEVAEDRDRAAGLAPHAHLVEQHFTREALHGKLGYSQLQFQFKGLEREDELENATVYEKEYQNNAITPNEYRERKGMAPLEDHEFADLLYADVEIAMKAAQAAAVVDDPDLKGPKTSSKPKPSK
jgi:Phage portal protein